MEQKVDNNAKCYKLLIFTCVGLYTTMMALKNVYVAEIATIIRVFNTTKSTASLMNTYYFITYSLMQFLLGFLMHKLNVKRYLLITIPISVFTYVFLALFIREITQMWWLFLLNGFAQAGVVACTKLTLGKYLPNEYTAKANALYSLAGGGGFAVSYGFSAICIQFFSWKLPFLVISAVFLAMLALYVISVKIAEQKCPVVVPERKAVLENHVEHEGLIQLNSNRSAVIFIVCCMFISFLHNTVLYGINNWLVSYLHEVFDFQESLSMVVTIILQVMAMIGPVTTIAVCNKARNYIKVMIAFYVLPFLIAVLMLFVFHVNMFFSIALLLVFEFFLAAGGAGMSVMSFDMRTQMNMGAISAFTNTSASIAAGVIPTIVGALIENFGWIAQYTFIVFALGILLLSLLFFVRILQAKKN